MIAVPMVPTTGSGLLDAALVGGVLFVLAVALGVALFGHGSNHELRVTSVEPTSKYEAGLRHRYEHKWEHMKRVREGGAGHVTLFTQQWLPRSPGAAPVKGVAVYVHGLHDHTSRWVSTHRLIDAGYAVRAIDLEGHGRSSGTHGYMTSVHHSVQDLAQFVRHSKQEHPEKPMFLVGGSMGGMMVLLTALALRESNDADLLRGLVVQCPLIHVAGDSDPHPVTVGIARILKALVPRLPLVAANKGKNSSPEVAEEVEADKDADDLVYSGWLRVGTGLALKDACKHLHARLHQVAHPFILQHGTADRAVSIEGSEELFSKSASSDKTYRRYDGAAHDLENEPEHISAAVIEDFISWMDERVEGARGNTATAPSQTAGAAASTAAN